MKDPSIIKAGFFEKMKEIHVILCCPTFGIINYEVFI